MARYLFQKSVILSDMLGLVKRKDPTPTYSLHTDQHGRPPPLPQYSQVCNITWPLTEYKLDTVRSRSCRAATVSVDTRRL